eukprot:444006-Hanusia_phi.AAC.2
MNTRHAGEIGAQEILTGATMSSKLVSTCVLPLSFFFCSTSSPSSPSTSLAPAPRRLRSPPSLSPYCWPHVEIFSELDLSFAHSSKFATLRLRAEGRHRYAAAAGPVRPSPGPSALSEGGAADPGPRPYRRVVPRGRSDNGG